VHRRFHVVCCDSATVFSHSEASHAETDLYVQQKIWKPIGRLKMRSVSQRWSALNRGLACSPTCKPLQEDLVFVLRLLELLPMLSGPILVHPGVLKTVASTPFSYGLSFPVSRRGVYSY
jgi:hypothetical protein